MVDSAGQVEHMVCNVTPQFALKWLKMEKNNKSAFSKKYQRHNGR